MSQLIKSSFFCDSSYFKEDPDVRQEALEDVEEESIQKNFSRKSRLQFWSSTEVHLDLAVTRSITIGHFLVCCCTCVKKMQTLCF